MPDSGSDRTDPLRTQTPDVMLVARSALFQVGLATLVIIFSLTAPVLLFCPLRWRYLVLSGWARSTLTWARWICGLRMEVTGRENLPEGPAIVFCNHQSTWETLATQLIFPPQVWVLKRELLWLPLFGWCLALTNPIAIRRAGSDRRRALRQVIEQGQERLNSGMWVVIFPEGTRYPAGTVGPFNPGGAMLAKQSGAPVVPMAHDAGRYWGGGSWLVRPGTVRVHIGEPIDTSSGSAKEINRKAEEWVRNAIGAKAADATGK